MVMSGSSVNDSMSVLDHDPGTLDAEIARMESEVSKSMTEIARLMEQKYKGCYPLFSALADCQEKIQLAFDSGRSKVEKLEVALKSVEESIRQASVDNPGRKLAAINRILERLGTLSEMEGCLNELWLSAEDGDGNFLRNVLVILRLEALGKFMEEEETMETLRDRIIPMLFIETSSRKSDLLMELDDYWRNFIHFPNVEKIRPGTVEMVIKGANRRKTSENLTALKKLDEFDQRLEEVAEFVWRSYLDRIIHAEMPPQCVLSRDDDDGNTTFSTTTSKDIHRTQKAEIAAVLTSLIDFFKALHRAFDEIVVDEVPLVRRLWTTGGIGERLVSTLVKDVLIPSIPSDGATPDTKRELLRRCEDFHSAMKELGFADDTNPFQGFVTNFEKYAVDKRCNHFVVKARELVIQPYIELVEVGSAEDEDEEVVGEIARKTDERLRLGDVDLARSAEWDKFSIKLFQFQKCKISKSTFDFVLLLQDCVLAAVQAETEVEACRLLTTARNLIDIFTSITPIHHQQALTTVPQIAAVFFNNCHYICHRLVSIKPDFQPSLAKSTKLPQSECNFAEYFVELRKLAGSILDQHLTQIRRQITTNLSADDWLSVVVGLQDDSKYKRCERALNACTMQIGQIAIVWRAVMPPTAFTHSVGVLASHLLTALVDAILSKEDLASSDAEMLSYLFPSVVKKLEKALTVGGDPVIHRVCEGPYQRMNEVIFCLKASMAEISHRWCEGKGLLAAWVKPVEVKQLIRALFQNTERRAQVLATIN